MSKFHVYLSYSGTMKTEVFYQLTVPMDEDLIEYEYPKNEGWIYSSKRSPTSSELLIKESPQSWLDASIIEKMILLKKQCPKNKSHITEEFFKELKIDVHNSIEANIILSDFNFAKDDEDQAFLVTKSFAERLTQSGLKGAAFVPVTINYSGAKNERSIPPVFALQFMGKNCSRPFSIKDAKNACPFCGRKPIICEVCGFKYSACPTCHQYPWRPLETHKGATDKSLVLSPPEQRDILVMEGSKWDGSDFVYCEGNSLFGYNLISKRALDWLLSIHAVHFCARPIQVCIDGMTAEQLKKLENAQKPIIC